jgi:hypothetical protein
MKKLFFKSKVLDRIEEAREDIDKKRGSFVRYY